MLRVATRDSMEYRFEDFYASVYRNYMIVCRF
jgi:hypothetical protein